MPGLRLVYAWFTPGYRMFQFTFTACSGLRLPHVPVYVYRTGVSLLLTLPHRCLFITYLTAPVLFYYFRYSTGVILLLCYRTVSLFTLLPHR